MDNLTLTRAAQNCCASSRAKFGGVWSADNFPLPTAENVEQDCFGQDFSLILHTYFIINTSKAGHPGQHWLLLFVARQQTRLNVWKTFVCIWDPLGIPIEKYEDVSDHLKSV